MAKIIKLRLVGLEDRLVPTSDPMGPFGDLGSIIRPLGGPTAEPQDDSFDIASFTQDLTDSEANKYSVGGLTFFSMGKRTDNPGTVAFTDWTLIGLLSPVSGVYTPLLLSAGTTTIYSGTGYGNRIFYTDGMYAVSTAANSSGISTAKGMFQISSGPGSFYASDLQATDGPLAVTSIQGGVVTTSSTSGYQNGQAIQFAGLSNATGILEATTYYVINSDANHPFTFGISATPGGQPVAGASSGAGSVTVDITTPLTVSSIVNGVVTTTNPSGYVAGQQVLFQNLAGADGGLTSGKAYYVVPVPDNSQDSLDPNQFAISETRDGDPLSANATGGTVQTAAKIPQNVTVSGGVATTSTPHNLLNGQAIRFSGLTGTTDLASGKTYYVILDSSTTATTFKISASLNGNAITDAAGIGGVLPDTSVPISVKSITNGIVETNQPSGFTNGQAVIFSDLTDPDGQFNTAATYYVVIDENADATHFSISLTPDGPVATNANSGSGKASLTLAGPPASLGMLLPTAVTIPISPITNESVVNVGFVPTRVQMAPQGHGLTGTDALTPVLLFSGSQVMNYQKTGFTAGIGGQGANQGKYLQMSTRGYLTYVDSGTGQSDVVITASFGTRPNQQPITVVDVVQGLITTLQPHGLSDKATIAFATLTGTAPGGLQVGVPYQVNVVEGKPNELRIVTNEINKLNANVLNATGGVMEPAVGFSINATGLVTTNVPHGFTVGGSFNFTSLVNVPVDFDITRTYFVQKVVDENSFQFGLSMNPETLVKEVSNSFTGLLKSPLFTLSGFDLGGSANIQFLMPSPTNETYQLNIGGVLSGSYTRSSGISGQFSIELGSGSGTAYGISMTWDKDGNLTIPDWAISLSGSFAARSTPDKSPYFTATMSGLTGQRTQNTDGSEDFVISGNLQASFPSIGMSTTVRLGLGNTAPGFAIHTDADGKDPKLASMNILAEFDQIQPAGAPLVQGTSIRIYGAQVTLTYSDNGGPNGTSVFGVGGSLSIAVGSDQVDKNGNWIQSPSLITVQASPDAILFDDGGIHFGTQEGAGDLQVALAGTFQVGVLTIVANAATVTVSWPQGGDVSVGVKGEVIFPQLGNTAVNLGIGNGTSTGGSGLMIDTHTGAWRIDGWRVNIGKLNFDSLILENISVGYTGGGSSTNPSDLGNWDLDLTGTVRLMKFGPSAGMAIAVKLDMGEVNDKFIVHSIGAQIRGLSPGIPIGETGGYATDIGLQADNIGQANWSGSFLLGGTFGNTITIAGKSAALMQVTVQGMVDAHEFDLIGTLLFAGGILGEVDANLDFDWGLGNYTIDLNGKFFYDAIEAQMELQITRQDITALASATIKVPSFVPIVGGKELGSGEIYFHHSLDGSTDSFIAGWGTLFDKWTDGFKHDFDTNTTIHIGATAVSQIEANASQTLQNKHQYTTSFSYSPPSSSKSGALLGAALQDSSSSSASRGLFHIVWDGLDPSSTVYVSMTDTDGTFVDIPVWGPNGAISGAIDTANNLSYSVSSNSRNGDIYVQVLSSEGDDPYVNLLPGRDFTVTLASDNQQAAILPANWSGSFTAPPPQLQNLTMAQPLGDALGLVGDGIDPNNVTIGMQYRTTDPSSLQIDLYYDTDNQGYDGFKIGSLSGTQLTSQNGNAEEWTNQNFTWNIKDLPPFPVYVYAVVHDGEHAPAKTVYSSMAVASQPEIMATISLGDGGLAPGEGKDWLVTATPVLHSPVQSVAVDSSINASVVTLSSPMSLHAGQAIQFDSLSDTVGISNDRSYYVVSVLSPTTFTISAALGGPVLFTAQSGSGMLFMDDPNGTPISHVTLISGLATLNPGAAGYYRVSVAPKSPAYSPDRYEVSSISSITIDSASGQSVVSMTNAMSLTPGQQIQFNNLVNPVGVVNGATYYVLQVTSTGFTFSTQPNGPAIAIASAQASAATTINSLKPNAQTVDENGFAIEYVNLGSASNTTNIEFSFVRNTIVSGRIYNDIAADGERSSADPGATGIVVYLDDNGNGALDPGELNTVSGSDGTYELYPVVDFGTTYSSTIRQVLPYGWAIAAANDDPSKSSLPIQLTTDSNQSLDNNFLDVQFVTMSGTVYSDTNANGVKDLGEAGLPGVTVNLSGPGVNASVTTASDGTWLYTTKTRGSYTITVQNPVGTAISAPFQITPILGNSVQTFFPITASNQSGFTSQTATASIWNPSTNVNDAYIGVTWQDSHGTGLVKIDGATKNATVVWAYNPSFETANMVTRIIPGANPSDQGQIFAIVEQGTSTEISVTQLVQINSDGTNTMLSATPGERFAAWPHLGSSGGLASVDPSGKVWAWSGSTVSRFAIGQVTGTPVDIVAFQPGSNKTATSQESLAILVNNNGLLYIQILNPNGSLGTPINVGGASAVSIAKGDYNSDGIDDLAVLTSTATLNGTQATVPYTVTILISDGNGSFEQVSYNDNGQIQHKFNHTPIRMQLQTVNLFGSAGDQLAWSMLYAPANNSQGLQSSTTNVLSVNGFPGGDLLLARSALNISNSLYSSDLVVAIGSSELLVAGNGTGLFPFNNNAGGYVYTINRQIDNLYSISSDWTQSGGQFAGFNIGLTGSTNAGTNQTISGVVFNDLNGNGIQDPGEEGLGNTPVQIIRPASTYTSRTFTGDSDSGVSATKNYTHALNFNGDDVVVNGVTFKSASSTGTNYSLVSYNTTTGETGGMYSYSGNVSNLTGSMKTLTTDFYYSSLGGEKLTLSGLTPGTTYIATFYGAGFDASGRIQTIYDSQGGMIVGYDEDENGLENGSLLQVTYTATSDTMTFTFVPTNGNYTYHQYAMTNEAIAGTSTPITGDENSGVDSSKTYTHALNFSGPDVAVNGVTFAGAQQSGSNYTLVSYDPVTGNTGEMYYVTNYNNSLTGGMNQLVADFYYSPLGGEQLTLSGLTPGTTYTATFYCAPYGSGTRIQTLTDNQGGQSLTFDEDQLGSAGGVIRYTYTATSTSIVLTFVPEDPGNTFHQYAMTNEVVSELVSSFAGDADSGISLSKTYTHAINFDGPSVTVNGVTFDSGSSSGTNYSVNGYDLSSGELVGLHGVENNPSILSGNSSAFTQNALYSLLGGMTVTLSGLTPGVTYTATFYGQAYGDDPRELILTDSQGGQSLPFDENQFGSQNGILLHYMFTAADSSINLSIAPTDEDPANTFFLYAMTNEVTSAIVSPVVGNQTVVTSDGSDGHAPGAYTAEGGYGGYYFRPVLPPGTTLPNSTIFSFLPAPFQDHVPTSFGPAKVASLTADLQGNGSTTLAFLSGSTIQLRLIKNDGTVYYEQYSTGLSPISSGIPDFAAVDVTGDGILDLVVAGHGGISLLQGIGLGQFAPAQTYLASQFSGQDLLLGAAAAEPGAAGSLYVAASGGTAIIPLEWDTGTGTLMAGSAITTSSPVQQLAAGDVDGDDEMDIVYYNGTEIHVLSGSDASTDTVVASFSGSAAPGRLIVDSLALNQPQGILLARQVSGAATLSYVQIGTTGIYNSQQITLGTVDENDPLWIAVGDFADDNNNQLDVFAGSDTFAWLFANTGPVSDPLTLVPSATINSAASSTQAFVPFSFTPHAPMDLVAIDSSGTLIGWHNLVHTVYVNNNTPLPTSYDLGVHLPGSGGGSITGTIWQDANNSGTWSSTDQSWYEGVSVYLDLNNNGKLDAGEPSETPSLTGQFTFKQLQPGTYPVRLLLGTDGVTTSMSQTWPSSNGALSITVPAGPGTAVYGADFGVYVNENSVDLNADGNPDLLLTDPTDQGVYAQLHHGTDRLASVRIGTLPGPSWSVVASGDYSGDGRPDILLHDSATGALRVWELLSGGGLSRVVDEFDLVYHVPAGFTIVGFGDPDRQGKSILVLKNNRTGQQRVVTFSGDNLENAQESDLALPSNYSVVGVGDLNGDGLNDMLLRNSSTKTLVARLYHGSSNLPQLVELGVPDKNWSVAGVLNLSGGLTSDDILFQDRNTGKAYIWELGSNAEVMKTTEIDIGDHDGLRIHLAEPQELINSKVKIGGFGGAATAAYKENAMPTLIGNVGTISDSRKLDFDGGTLTIWLSSNGTADDRLSIKHTSDAAGKIGVDFTNHTIRYGGVQIATFSGGSGSIPLAITFNSSAFKAAVQATLKAITFANTSENPSISTRTVSFVLTDGDGGVSNTTSRKVKLTVVNDKPIMTSTGSTVNYAEGGIPAIVDIGIVLSDVDSTNFAGGKLIAKIAAGGESTDRLGIQASGSISLNSSKKEVLSDGVVIGTYSGTTTLIITLNKNATPTIVQDLARHIAFSSISGNPSTTTRQISFTVADGDGGTSDAALGDMVTITLANNPPALKLSNPKPIKYTENALPIAISAGATITDVDSANFDGGTLTVAVTTDGTSSDVLSVRNIGKRSGQISVVGNSIRYTNGRLSIYEVATFTGGDGANPLVITFNSSARTAEVQAAMRAIAFANTSDNPSTAQRTVSFTLTDGDGGASNTVIRSINVIAINDAPTITNFTSHPIQYMLGGSPTLLAPSAIITDADSADFLGGKLTVSLKANKQALDRIGILEGNGITVSGNIISYNSNPIGTFSGTTTLTVAFSTPLATPTAVQALLRQLAFRTISSSIRPRTFTITLSDGDSGLSELLSKSILVTR